MEDDKAKIQMSLNDLSNEFVQTDDEKEKEKLKEAEEAEKIKIAEEEAKAKEIEEDQKAADAASAKDNKADDIEDNNVDGNNDADDFDWTTVNKLVGIDINIKELEIEPTPQGAAKYANAVWETKLSDFEENLEKNYPREYEALQLAIEGKDPSVLYKQKESIDYSKFDIKSADTDTQKEILSGYYADKGLSKDKITSLVKMAEDDGKLKEDFIIAVNELKVKSEAEQKVLQDSVKEQRKQEQELITSVSNTLKDKIIKSGEVGNFVIPVKDRNDLYNSLAEKFQYSNGKFYIVKEYNEKEIDKEIQAEFFKLKNGNLSEFINTKANTITTNRLRNQVNKDRNGNSSSQTGGNRKSLSLKELDE